MNKENKIKVGISIGDINGIGIEVILKTFADKRMLDFCIPVIFGSTKVLSYYNKLLKTEIQFHGISDVNKITENKINSINSWNEDVEITPGKSTKTGGKYAYISLKEAVKSLKSGAIDVLITAPINKENIQSEEFNFAGHTEFLESEIEGKSLMILMSDTLRVGLITGHIPISEVSNSITPELIKEKVAILYNSLQQDFGISKPKIALLGLNPHSGDNGLIGKEDEEIIRPTVKELFESKKLIYGPYAADGFFGSNIYKQFDGILAMYHDQGLAPFKALSFGKGVNFTAGLKLIRTSPDHGTAYEIAGKGVADNSSFKEAFFKSIELYKKRRDYLQLNQNKLKASKRL